MYSPLKQVFKNIWQTPGEHVYSDHVKTSAILVQDQPSGNNLVFYSSKHLQSREALQRAEGNLLHRDTIWRQFVNHRDEASVYSARLWRSLNQSSSSSSSATAGSDQAWLYCHEKEMAQVLSNTKMDFAEEWVKSFDSTKLLDGRLLLIHTPGHCPGSTCFLWTDQADNGRRYLFTGDTIYFDESGDSIEWKYNLRVHPYEGNVQDMIDSMQKIAHLEFDVLVPSLSMSKTMNDHDGVPMINLTLPQNRQIKSQQMERMLQELQADLDKYNAQRGKVGAEA